MTIKAAGTSVEDFHLLGEQVQAVRSTVKETAVLESLGGGLVVIREWHYDLADGRSVDFVFDRDSDAKDEALETALASAAGWLA
jgi:hypothetical protein